MRTIFSFIIQGVPQKRLSVQITVLIRKTYRIFNGVLFCQSFKSVFEKRSEAFGICLVMFTVGCFNQHAAW